MEYPEGCSTAMRRVARKVATVEGGLVWFRGGITAGIEFSGQVDLYITLDGFVYAKKVSYVI